MSTLIDRFRERIKRIFCFDALDVWKLLSVMKKEALLCQDKDRASSVAELCDIFQYIRDFRGYKRTLREHKVLYTTNDLWIHSIGPTKQQIDKYERRISRAFGKTLELNDLRYDNDKNMISGVIYVRFGKTAVLLGGDAERASWDSILRDCEDLGFELHPQIIKASHHGSFYAYHEGFWSKERAADSPYVIVTPYIKYGLPNRGVVERLTTGGYRVISTWPVETFESQDLSRILNETTRMDEVLGRLDDDSKGWVDAGDLAEAPGICTICCDNEGNVEIEMTQSCQALY